MFKWVSKKEKREEEIDSSLTNSKLGVCKELHFSKQETIFIIQKTVEYGEKNVRFYYQSEGFYSGIYSNHNLFHYYGSLQNLSDAGFVLNDQLGKLCCFVKADCAKLEKVDKDQGEASF